MSTLALRLIAENKKTKATRPDLGNCGLTAMPTSFPKKLLIFDPKPTNPS